jgi:hypothetical protein
MGARLDGLGHGHDESRVRIEDVRRVDNRQSDDPVAAGSEAKDVPLGCFFAFAGLRWAGVQIQDVAVLVLVGRDEPPTAVTGGFDEHRRAADIAQQYVDSEIVTMRRVIDPASAAGRARVAFPCLSS